MQLVDTQNKFTYEEMGYGALKQNSTTINGIKILFYLGIEVKLINFTLNT